MLLDASLCMATPHRRPQTRRTFGFPPQILSGQASDQAMVVSGFQLGLAAVPGWAG